MVVRFQTSTKEDAALLASRMRQSDRDEVLASGGFSPLEAIEASIDVSMVAVTGFIDEEIAVIFGVMPNGLLSDRGIPWALTTHVIDRHPKTFLKYSRRVIENMLPLFPVLENFVDARYTQAVRWLSVLGFEVLPPIPFGVSGLPFHPFVMRRK